MLYYCWMLCAIAGRMREWVDSVCLSWSHPEIVEIVFFVIDKFRVYLCIFVCIS